jgi:hypothetical protein
MVERGCELYESSLSETLLPVSRSGVLAPGIPQTSCIAILKRRAQNPTHGGMVGDGGTSIAYPISESILGSVCKLQAD